jgi:hypothetical protein
MARKPTIVIDENIYHWAAKPLGSCCLRPDTGYDVQFVAKNELAACEPFINERQVERQIGYNSVTQYVMHLYASGNITWTLLPEAPTKPSIAV